MPFRTYVRASIAKQRGYSLIFFLDSAEKLVDVSRVEENEGEDRDYSRSIDAWAWRRVGRVAVSIDTPCDSLFVHFCLMRE